MKKAHLGNLAKVGSTPSIRPLTSNEPTNVMFFFAKNPIRFEKSGEKFLLPDKNRFNPLQKLLYIVFFLTEN